MNLREMLNLFLLLLLPLLPLLFIFFPLPPLPPPLLLFPLPLPPLLPPSPVLFSHIPTHREVGSSRSITFEVCLKSDTV